MHKRITHALAAFAIAAAAMLPVAAIAQTVDEIIAWGIAHWQLARVPRQQKIVLGAR